MEELVNEEFHVQHAICIHIYFVQRFFLDVYGIGIIGHVYTDSSLDIEGFNYYLNNRFREILSHRKINSNIVVKDLVMVNVDTLIMFEKAFTDKKVKFDVLLNEYIAYKESKEQNRVVPFNKYLFQKCKQKGYFYKASYIVRDVIDEMIAREKQQVSKA